MTAPTLNTALATSLSTTIFRQLPLFVALWHLRLLLLLRPPHVRLDTTQRRRPFLPIFCQQAEGLYILAVLWSSTTRQVGGHDLSAARIALMLDSASPNYEKLKSPNNSSQGAFASVLEAPDRGTHPFSKLCCTFVAFLGSETKLFCRVLVEVLHFQ